MAGEKTTGDKKTGGKPSAAKAKGGETIEGKAEDVSKPKKRTSPIEFARQVRQEGEKVTWTSWKETRISTLMVFVMVFVMAIFFLIVDQALRFAVCTGLQLHCGAPS